MFENNVHLKIESLKVSVLHCSEWVMNHILYIVFQNTSVVFVNM